MNDEMEPDNTAVRVALWRALHVEIDAPPHVLTDEIGLQLVDPAPGWQQRRDMDPRWTSRNRASIVGRARFVEDLVEQRAGAGVDQYVVLGAGVDTFAQRRGPGGAPLEVFEIDQPGTQAWKRRRLAELGFATPEWLHFVPVDFEAGVSWRERLAAEGFGADRPAVVASTGVTMYLTKDTVAESLREAARCASGSEYVLSFMVPLELVAPDEHGALQGAERGARAAGTPWISFFTPAEMVDLATSCGFRTVRHVAPDELAERYFAERTDGLRPSSAEHLVVAITG